jgi:hypothetical protein
MPRLSYFRKLAGQPAGNPIRLAPSRHPFRRGEGAVAEPVPLARPKADASTATAPQIATPRAPEASPIPRSQPARPPRAHVPQESPEAEPLARPPETAAAFTPEIAKEPEEPRFQETNLAPPPGPTARSRPAESPNRPQPLERHSITIHENHPEPAPRPLAAAAAQPRIEIGSIEIEIVAPPSAPAPKPATPPARRQSTAIRRTAPAPLARGFGSILGLRQG